MHSKDNFIYVNLCSMSIYQILYSFRVNNGSLEKSAKIDTLQYLLSSKPGGGPSSERIIFHVSLHYSRDSQQGYMFRTFFLRSMEGSSSLVGASLFWGRKWWKYVPDIFCVPFCIIFTYLSYFRTCVIFTVS